MADLVSATFVPDERVGVQAAAVLCGFRRWYAGSRGDFVCTRRGLGAAIAGMANLRGGIPCARREQRPSLLSMPAGAR